MVKVHLVIKYTFYVVLVLGAGLAVERLAKIEHWRATDSLTQENLVYNGSSPLAFESFNRVLKKHYLRCITNPSKPFCLLSANKRLQLFESDQAGVHNAEVIESRLKNINSDLHPRRLRMHSLLKLFTSFMKNYDIKVFVIEPSMLFCLLSSEKKYKMVMKGFNPSRLQGSRNVATLGVLAEDSRKLEEVDFTKELLSAGFKIMKFRKLVGKETVKSFETVHYFFILQGIAVHVVVFYPQNTYMWHAGLDAQGAILEDLLFVEDGIFENFTLLPLKLEGTSISQIYLPYDMRYFMREMGVSKIMECREISSNNVPLMKHPYLTLEQLNNRALIAFKELKTILAPQLVLFWLWSKTLLGWFTKCDIFHYSTTLELAIAHKGIEDLDLSVLLADNDFLRVANKTESKTDYEYKVICHGLEINLFILHEDKDSMTLEHTDEENTQNVQYPEFSLCSTNIFSQKMHVPCNTEEVLKLEYKKQWKNTNLLKSLKNEPISWEKNEKE